MSNDNYLIELQKARRENLAERQRLQAKFGLGKNRRSSSSSSSSSSEFRTYGDGGESSGRHHYREGEQEREVELGIIAVEDKKPGRTNKKPTSNKTKERIERRRKLKEKQDKGLLKAMNGEYLNEVHGLTAILS